jgi:hypothetical protein
MEGQVTKFYKATFSDGSIRTRSTTYRQYTHAYRLGFSSSAQLAKQAANSCSWLPDKEVVPVEEITAKEYRAHLAARKFK